MRIKHNITRNDFVLDFGKGAVCISAEQAESLANTLSKMRSVGDSMRANVIPQINFDCEVTMPKMDYEAEIPSTNL